MTTPAAREARRDARRRRRQAVVSCGKRAVAFLFSHVGLAAMVVAYSILGGFLFQALEADHERQVKVRQPDVFLIRLSAPMYEATHENAPRFKALQNQH